MHNEITDKDILIYKLIRIAVIASAKFLDLSNAKIEHFTDDECIDFQLSLEKESYRIHDALNQALVRTNS